MGTVSHRRRSGHEPDADELAELRRKVEASYLEQTDVRYAAARLWVDALIDPVDTRHIISEGIKAANHNPRQSEFKTGVFQV